MVDPKHDALVALAKEMRTAEVEADSLAYYADMIDRALAQPGAGERAEYRCNERIDGGVCGWRGTRDDFAPRADGVLYCPACNSVAIVEPEPSAPRWLMGLAAREHYTVCEACQIQVRGGGQLCDIGKSLCVLERPEPSAPETSARWCDFTRRYDCDGFCYDACHRKVAADAGPTPAVQPEPGAVEACVWHLDDDDDSGTWETACGHAFTFNDDGPKENHAAFCCYCGKRLEESRTSDDRRLSSRADDAEPGNIRLNPNKPKETRTCP